MIGILKMTIALQEFARSAGERMSDDRGATAVEYGMIVALIAAVIVVVVAAVGQDVLGGFQTIDNEIP